MKFTTVICQSLAALVLVVPAGCSKRVPQALGTLEFDRITLPAPAAERIVAIDVREGEQVRAGQPLLQLDPAHTRAQLAAAQAQLEQQRELLAELQAGPRREDIAKARANLAAVQAQAREARAYYARLASLKGNGYVAAADLDRARAAAGNAEGQTSAARAALDELLHGTRPEQLAQAQAAVAAAEAQMSAQQVLLGKLAVVAPRASTLCRTGWATKRRSARRWRSCWPATRRTRASTCRCSSAQACTSATPSTCSWPTAKNLMPASCA